jgi:transcriptional regulator with XRE-family HTH domain
MCRWAGVGQQNITELKKGRQSGLSAKNLDKIANFFGVSVSYLLGTENSPSGDEELNEYLELLRIRPEMKVLFHTFSGASKEEIEAIVLAWEARNNIK